MLIAGLQRDALEASVTPTTLHAQPSTPTRARGATEVLSLVLHGTYPNVKRVLAATADRHPGLSVDRLSLRRSIASSDIDAALIVTLGIAPPEAARPASR